MGSQLSSHSPLAPWSHQPSLFPSLPHDHCHGLVMLTWKGLLFTIIFAPSRDLPSAWGQDGARSHAAIPAHCPGLAALWGSSRVRDKALISPSPGTKHILAENENFWRSSLAQGWEGRPWAGVWLGYIALLWQVTDLLPPALTGWGPRPCVRIYVLPSLRVHEREEQKRKNIQKHCHDKSRDRLQEKKKVLYRSTFKGLSCFLNKGPWIHFALSSINYVVGPAHYCHHIFQTWKLNFVQLVVWHRASYLSSQSLGSQSPCATPCFRKNGVWDIFI